MTATWSLPLDVNLFDSFRSPVFRPERIRVVIPTFRDWDAARETIESLLDYRPGPAEIVLVDDKVPNVLRMSRIVKAVIEAVLKFYRRYEGPAGEKLLVETVQEQMGTEARDVASARKRNDADRRKVESTRSRFPGVMLSRRLVNMRSGSSWPRCSSFSGAAYPRNARWRCGSVSGWSRSVTISDVGFRSQHCRCTPHQILRSASHWRCEGNYAHAVVGTGVGVVSSMCRPRPLFSSSLHALIALIMAYTRQLPIADAFTASFCCTSEVVRIEGCRHC